MSNIKNFGLVGVATDVQFGKAGPRLINDTNVFKFKDAAGTNAASFVAGNATVAGLTVGSNGTITMGGNKVTNVADGAALTDAVTLGQLNAAITTATGAASSANTALQTEVDQMEAALGLAADGKLVPFAVGSVAETATTFKSAIEMVEAALAGEITRAQVAEALTSGNLTAEVDRAKAAEKVVSDGLAAEITRAQAAEDALSTRITTEVADRTAADQALADALQQELDLRFQADTTLQSNIDAEAAARAAAVTTLRNDMNAKLAGLTWEAPVNSIVVDSSTVDLTGKADGFRIVDTTLNKIFTVAGGALDAGEALVEGAAFFHLGDEVGYVFNGTALVQFNGASNIVAGAGIVKTGNTLSLASTSGTITIGEDTIDVAQSVLDSITNVASNLAGEVLVARANEAGLGQRIDDEIAAREAADTALTAAYQAADTALQANIDAEVTRAKAAEGTLTANLAAEVTRATGEESRIEGLVTAEVTRATGVEAGLVTRLDAIDVLNGQQDDRLDALEAKTTADSGALQAEVDFMEAALGLATDGKLVDFTSVNYIGATDTFALAINKLDTALKNMDVAYKAADAIVLSTAEAYTDTREASILAYVDGKVALLTTAIATAKSEAITAAQQYADAGDATTLAAAKLYADNAAQTAVNSVKHIAKSVYQEFAYTDNPQKSIALDVQGRVHRVKIMIDTGFADASSIQVGTASANGELMTTADVDSTTPGVYVVEINKLYTNPTELFVFVGGTNVAGAGAVIVEYFTV